jgi:hypothetical protein
MTGYLRLPPPPRVPPPRLIPLLILLAPRLLLARAPLLPIPLEAPPNALRFDEPE